MKRKHRTATMTFVPRSIALSSRLKFGVTTFTSYVSFCLDESLIIPYIPLQAQLVGLFTETAPETELYDFVAKRFRGHHFKEVFLMHLKPYHCPYNDVLGSRAHALKYTIQYCMPQAFGCAS